MFRKLSLPISEIIILIFCVAIGIVITYIVCDISEMLSVKEFNFGPVDKLTKEQKDEISEEMTRTVNKNIYHDGLSTKLEK